MHPKRWLWHPLAETNSNQLVVYPLQHNQRRRGSEEREGCCPRNKCLRKVSLWHPSILATGFPISYEFFRNKGIELYTRINLLRRWICKRESMTWYEGKTTGQSEDFMRTWKEIRYKDVAKKQKGWSEAKMVYHWLSKYCDGSACWIYFDSIHLQKCMGGWTLNIILEFRHPQWVRKLFWAVTSQ